MKRKEIRKLQQLAKLAAQLSQLGETAAANTIQFHIAHTVYDAFERTPNGKASSSSTV